MGNNSDFCSGLVALAGCPNVGKSTLLNRFVRRKISITSRRANTTRYRILGILNEAQRQFVFVDMPGYNAKGKRLVDRSIHKIAVASMQGVDLALLLLEPKGLHEHDKAVWHQLRSAGVPTIVVINKIDRLKNRDALLPVIKEIADRTGLTTIVPVSAKKGEGIESLKDCISAMLPSGPPLFPDAFITDKSDRFQVGELVREQIFRSFGAELPYISAVQIEKYTVDENLVELDALIWVETQSQKKIFVGRKGEKIKLIGSNVRKHLEARSGKHALVQLWVKVQPRWTESQRHIEQFGYAEAD